MQILKRLFILVLLTGCDSVTPGNFWLNFENENITDTFSDHGPWGGTSVMHWELETKTFDEYELREFGEEHGWTFYKTVNEFIFPYEDEPHPKLEKYLKRDLTILTFKTDWILVEPGTGESFDALGYVILNSKRTNMTVFHQWGE